MAGRSACAFGVLLHSALHPSFLSRTECRVVNLAPGLPGTGAHEKRGEQSSYRNRDYVERFDFLFLAGPDDADHGLQSTTVRICSSTSKPSAPVLSCHPFVLRSRVAVLLLRLWIASICNICVHNRESMEPRLLVTKLFQTNLRAVREDGEIGRPQ